MAKVFHHIWSTIKFFYLILIGHLPSVNAHSIQICYTLVFQISSVLKPEF